MKSTKAINPPRQLFHLRVLLLFSLLLLTIFAHRYPYFALDLRISQALQQYRNPIFSGLMNLVSELGDDFHLAVIVSITVGVLLYLRYLQEAFRISVAVLVSVITGTTLKYLVARPRPEENLVRIQELLVDKSFPSLHVLVFTVFFSYLLYLAWTQISSFWFRYLVVSISLLLILTVGLSRIYLGAHWPSDTLGGYLSGLLIITFFIPHAKR